MKRPYALLLLAGCLAGSAHAQCTPTFSGGCFSWQNQAITVGATSWSPDADCSVGDYTDLHAMVEPGAPIAMTVTNGNWCGCGVWVDLDQDGTFSDAENLYHLYDGEMTHTYTFDIELPAATPDGMYTARIVAGWGTDCFTVSDNGYGPCGSYQYGNYTDLTLHVGDNTGVEDAAAAPVAMLQGPNPTTGLVVLNTAAPLDRVIVRGLDGRVMHVEPLAARTGEVRMDLSVLPAGMYMLECRAGDRVSSIRMVRD